MAAVSHQSQCGRRCFDALGNQLQIERLGEADDRPDDGQIAAAGAQIANERCVDFERVDRQRFQVLQNGVTRAEVVDGDLDADFFQRLEGLAGGVDIADHGALGDLQTH